MSSAGEPSRKRSVDSAISPPEQGKEKRAKKPRSGLSCSECKRRKIKCNRELPCEACVRRGKPHECVWEEFANASSMPATIARAKDLDALSARLAHVETFLAKLPPNLTQSFKPLPTGMSIGPSTSANAPSPMRIQNAKSDDFSDVEDAAATLEDGVFGAPPANGQSGAGVHRTSSKEARQAQTPHVGKMGFTNTFGGTRHLELTPELTSIVAPERPPHMPPLSTAHLDTPFDASPEQIDEAYRRAVRKCTDILPDSNVIDYLVDLYFAKSRWLFHCLHSPTIQAEVKVFHKFKQAGREEELDVLWLALLLMILCMSLDSTHSSRSPLALDELAREGKDTPLASMSLETRRRLPDVWFAAAQKCLALAEWESVPRVRTVQIVVLFTQYLKLCAPNRGQPCQMATWLAGGIRIAQALGLHLLGSNPEVMPPAEDSAFPPGKNARKRESAKRLWSVLVYEDWMSANATNRAHFIAQAHYDTDDPSNVNDTDLSPVDWRINPASPSVLTDSTPERVRIALARQCRKVFEATVLNKSCSYETILELDAGFHDVLDGLPDRWREVEFRGVGEQEQPLLRYQRHFALEGIHHRLFRLHRPFLMRGYHHPQFAYSTKACLKSAEVVVVSTHNLGAAIRDVHYTYSHVMGGSLALFADLFHAIDTDVSPTELDAKREILMLAQNIFRKYESITCGHLQRTVKQGFKIITGLFAAEEKRRVSRVAQALITAAGDEEATSPAATPVATESFSEVLTRLSRSLLEQEEEQHCGTPPATRGLQVPLAPPPQSTEQSNAAAAAMMMMIPGLNGAPPSVDIGDSLMPPPWPETMAVPPMPMDTWEPASLSLVNDLPPSTGTADPSLFDASMLFGIDW